MASRARKRVIESRRWARAPGAISGDRGRSQLGNSDGRVLCYARGGKGRIEWITLRSGVHAYAEAANFGRLLEWWRNEAGPIN